MAEVQRTDDFGEILRQAERMLAVQYDSRESALRRTGELLRLGIAILGGAIVVGGIVVTTSIQVDPRTLVLVVLGVLVVGAAVARFAVILVGRGEAGRFVSGPDLERSIAWKDGNNSDAGSVVESFARASPLWLEQNEAAIASLQRAKSVALILLVVGSLVLLGGLVYIFAGAIHD